MPGERNESVLLNEWHQGLKPLPADAEFDVAFWDKIFAVRDAASKKLEALRNVGKIKGGLTAEVTLYADEAVMALLDKVKSELKFILITSKVTVLGLGDKAADVEMCDVDGLAILAVPTEHARCDRCWHQTEDVGQDETHPELCGRCIENVDGEGEQRHYA